MSNEKVLKDEQLENVAGGYTETELKMMEDYQKKKDAYAKLHEQEAERRAEEERMRMQAYADHQAAMRKQAGLW